MLTFLDGKMNKFNSFCLILLIVDCLDGKNVTKEDGDRLHYLWFENNYDVTMSSSEERIEKPLERNRKLPEQETNEEKFESTENNFNVKHYKNDFGTRKERRRSR